MHYLRPIVLYSFNQLRSDGAPSSRAHQLFPHSPLRRHAAHIHIRSTTLLWASHF
jgi:hypothetical protein